MKTENAEQLRVTANAFKELFPDRLPKNFAASFDPEKFSGFGPDIITAKTELLKLLVAKPEPQKQEAIELWKQLFRDDSTFKEVPTHK